jgi:hypothetical protein
LQYTTFKGYIFEPSVVEVTDSEDGDGSPVVCGSAIFKQTNESPTKSKIKKIKKKIK